MSDIESYNFDIKTYNFRGWKLTTFEVGNLQLSNLKLTVFEIETYKIRTPILNARGSAMAMHGGLHWQCMGVCIGCLYVCFP
jgi:hypothetical protein